MKVKSFVEFSGEKYSLNDIELLVKNEVKKLGYKTKEVSTVNIYFKPEENMVYYVISLTNSEDEISGKLPITDSCN